MILLRLLAFTRSIVCPKRSRKSSNKDEKMCCSCSTCACCTVFVASLLLATIFAAGYLIVKKNQVDRFVSRDFKKKFFSMCNFLATYSKVYIKRSLAKSHNQKEQIKQKQQYNGQSGHRPPIRLRPNQWQNG